MGDDIGVVARGPVREFKIVGTVKYAGLSSLGGATLAVFTLPTAQALFHKVGQLDEIDVAAAHGVSNTKLVDRDQAAAAGQRPGANRPGPGAAGDERHAGFLNIFQDFLLAFGGMALFVGSFVIANTLSITVAQRTRELATLRTLGATRRQVRASVMLEALVIGVLASVVGLVPRAGAREGAERAVRFVRDRPAADEHRVQDAHDHRLTRRRDRDHAARRPAPGHPIDARPPIAAVREGSVLPPGRFERYGAYPAIGTISAAFALMLIGLLVSSLSTGLRLLSIGIGAVLVFVGVSMLAPRLVPPLVRVLGWPATKIGGGAGELARGNSLRNPSRTATTASALMIGLALVTLVGVLAAGLKSRFDGAVNQLFVANYAVTATNNFSPIGVASAGGDPGRARCHGRLQRTRRRRQGLRLAYQRHRRRARRQPRDRHQMEVRKPADAGAARQQRRVRRRCIRERSISKVGSPLSVETPTGNTLHLTLRVSPRHRRVAHPYGDVTISTARFDQVYQNPQNLFTFVNIVGGVTSANTAKLNAALDRLPGRQAPDQRQFKSNQEQGLTSLLNLLYVLLSLSIIISLFGIVNTLVLTVFERTRELGMLRAVGMSRRQVRRMIRHESVITALLGAAFGSRWASCSR